MPESGISSWQSFRNYNPGWQILLSNYNRTRDFLGARNPNVLRFLWTMTAAGNIVDVARYAILTELGGVYADIDVEMTWR